MGQERQGGSTIGYVLIGVVLIAGLVGGVYALRQATAQTPVDVATQSSEENKKEQQQAQRLEEQKPEASGNEGKAADAPTSNTPIAETEPPKEETPQAETKPAPTNERVELPQTGADNVGSWLALGLVGGAGVAYVRSRRFTLT